MLSSNRVNNSVNFCSGTPAFSHTQGLLQPLPHVSLSFLENSFSIPPSFITAVSQLMKFIMVEKITSNTLVPENLQVLKHNESSVKKLSATIILLSSERLCLFLLYVNVLLPSNNKTRKNT